MISTSPERSPSSRDRAPTEPAAAAPPADHAGRDRILRNVMASWGGHLVFVASGFVMPRLLDYHVGQRELGVWDFGWSLVSYFELAQIGIGSSVNRFVARYRSVGDTEGLRRTVSTVTSIQVAAAILILLLTGGLVAGLPTLFGQRLGEELAVARWVVGLLGASLAVQMAFDGFRGVITGCHRWDLHNGLTSGFHTLTVAGMMTALTLGGGLRAVAMTYLVGMIGSEVSRAILAHRVCPELQVRWAYASWEHARSLMVFGSKTLADAISRLLLFQGSNIIVASYLGPGALAVYARPVALVRHAETLTNKFAFILTPAASSLQSSGQHEELRDLFIQGTRFAVFLTLPLVITLVVTGDLILRLWMGPAYQSGPVLTILAIGYMIPLSQRPAMQVLMGMNRHGWVAISSLIMAVAGLMMGAIAVGPLNWGLAGAALAVSLPLSLGKGVFTAVYACRTLKVTARDYVRRAFLGPIACAIPFGAALLIGRELAGGHPGRSLLVAFACGGLILGPLYWRFALSATVKYRLLRKLPWATRGSSRALATTRNGGGRA